MTKVEDILSKIDQLQEEIDSLRKQVQGMMVNTDLDKLVLKVCQKAMVRIYDVKSSSRKQEFVNVRMVIAKIARKRGFTLKEIGKALGYRDHSTVNHYLNNVDPMLLYYGVDYYEMFISDNYQKNSI